MNAMIPVSTIECQTISWKNLLKSAITDPFELLEKLSINPADLTFALDHTPDFRIRVPQPFIDKMKSGDPKDPLLLQVISQQIENINPAEFSLDPLAETENAIPGLLHKYSGRVLLILAAACAVNCRYCFRRHFPYQDKQASGSQLQACIEYIKNDPSISEVILSGGDPLVLTDGALHQLVSDLEQISHVVRLRIHTRLPVVIPQRVTDALCTILARSRFKTCLVLHINHPQEIDSLLVNALDKLRNADIQLFNQAVLLKNINDDIDTLHSLSESLFAAGVIPYYLHLLDKVSGAAHFDVSEASALSIIHQLRSRLPGYLVPRLAREEAAKSSKTVLA